MEELELKGNLIIQRRVGNVSFFIEGFRSDRSMEYRTTGLKDRIGHELEYTLSLDPAEVVRITDYMLPIILKGYELKDGEVTNELTGAPVMVKIVEPRHKYQEDEKVARIIFSDPDFKLPNQMGCHPGYAKQLD